MCGWWTGIHIVVVAMRQKAFFLFLACVFLTSLFMLMLPARRHRTLKTLVKETQDKFINLRENIISAGESLDSGQISLNPDARYLNQLGLSTQHSSAIGLLSDDLVICSAVEPGYLHLVPGFIRSATKYQPDATILLFDLGLSRKDKTILHRRCNSTQCSPSEFQFSEWPNHVKDLKLKAYRPIIVQLALRESSLVLWMDIDCRFSTNDLSVWMVKVKSSGVVAWAADPPTKGGKSSALDGMRLEMGDAVPTTALTHPRMFEYFPQVKKEDYEFQHMVSGRGLLFYLSPEVEEHQLVDTPAPPAAASAGPPPGLTSALMLPWLKCVLIEDCINPIGAQSTGCRFDKKPQYRYSGCHSYDVSAFNIVLGEMFGFHESRYLSNRTFISRLNTEVVPSSAPTPYLNVSEYGLV